MRKTLAICLIGVLIFNTGCSASTTKLHPVTPKVPAKILPVSETGKTSWYGPRFHGRKTANGETFNKNAMTAAHKFLPFGTEIEVTDITTKRSVRVRINDRGPFKPGRILDLSQAAASSLGIVERGVVNIQIRVIKRG
jgi:rare lipoprotein A